MRVFFNHINVQLKEGKKSPYIWYIYVCVCVCVRARMRDIFEITLIIFFLDKVLIYDVHS